MLTSLLAVTAGAKLVNRLGCWRLQKQKRAEESRALFWQLGRH